MKMANLIGMTTLIVATLSLAGFAAASPSMQSEEVSAPKTETIILGGGCFWCLQPLFEMVKGVKHVDVGYCGGEPQGVDYEEVCAGNTGHAESLKIQFDPSVISGDVLLKIFFTVHDPTTLNAQGPDHGTQYRSVIFYDTVEERDRAKRIIDEIGKDKIWPRPIVTSVEPVKNWTRAEEYHQDYYAKYEHASLAQRMTMNAGYCNAIIEPKVLHFRAKFKAYLKN